MQCIERAEDGGDLPANESLGLRALLREPRSEIAMLRIFHRQAVAHARSLGLGKAIEDAQRTRLSRQQLGEVGFAKPRGEPIADLDTDLRGKSLTRNRRGDVDLAEPSLPDQPVEAIAATCLRAVHRRR